MSTFARPNNDPRWRIAANFIVYGGLMAAFASWVSIRWVDHPVATWIHQNGVDQHLWMRTFLDAPIALAPLGAIYMLGYILRRARSNPGVMEWNWFVVSLSLAFSLHINRNVLKIAFGRTWPRLVTDPSASAVRVSDCIGPSQGFLNDGIDAFHPFGGTIKAYSAFPSGSTAALIAIVVPLFVLFPRLRIPLALYTLLSLVAFVLTNTHYVGDVLAGFYVGAVCGIVAVAFFKGPIAPVFKWRAGSLGA